MRGTPTEDASCSCYNAQFEGEWHFYCLPFFPLKTARAHKYYDAYYVHTSVYMCVQCINFWTDISYDFHMLDIQQSYTYMRLISWALCVHHMMLINSLCADAETKKLIIKIIITICLGSRALSAVKTHKINLNISFMTFLFSFFSIPNN